ncbi:unnamed protein product, partial [Staurois parvus]
QITRYRQTKPQWLTTPNSLSAGRGQPSIRPKSSCNQGRTDNSWGPQAIGDHGAPLSLPKHKKSYEKGTRGISWGPLLAPGPLAAPEFPNGQSAPGC